MGARKFFCDGWDYCGCSPLAHVCHLMCLLYQPTYIRGSLITLYLNLTAFYQSSLSVAASIYSLCMHACMSMQAQAHRRDG